MCRTTINVTGDLTATLVMKKLTGFSNTSEKTAKEFVNQEK
jgi:proton glutamate symport protein